MFSKYRPSIGSISFENSQETSSKKLPEQLDKWLSECHGEAYLPAGLLDDATETVEDAKNIALDVPFIATREQLGSQLIVSIQLWCSHQSSRVQVAVRRL